MTNEDMELLGDTVIALQSVVEDLLRLAHLSFPAEIEENLRQVRLLTQAVETGNAPSELSLALRPLRLRRSLYEQSLGRANGS